MRIHLVVSRVTETYSVEIEDDSTVADAVSGLQSIPPGASGEAGRLIGRVAKVLPRTRRILRSAS